MEKRVKISFKAQSKAVTEEVTVEYILNEEEASSEKYINDELLKELK
jgi:hypothetical protein